MEPVSYTHLFAEAFFLAPLKLDFWRIQAEKWGVGASLHFDPALAYPHAGCILLLVYPYAPFAAEERLSAYYLASQRGYFATKSLSKQLQTLGISCEMASVPARALALANGVGIAGKNGILRIGALGSRFALYTLCLLYTSHACGHDIHTAILLGTAEILKGMESELPGAVKLFFQPAEETTGGARGMIEHGCLNQPRVTRVMSLHVDPNCEAGKVLICNGKMNASCLLYTSRCV